MLEVLHSLLFSTLDAAPALVFAALGAVLSERAGVVDVGVEGMMRAGAFCAAVAALAMPTPLAVVVGMGAGAGMAAIHGWLCIRWRSDQVVSGMALNLVALAGGTFLLESLFGPNGTPPITQLSRWDIPGLASVPVLGALSGHAAPTYLALLVPFVFQGLLTRTPLGLRLRAVGDKPHAVATLGLSVPALRWGAVVGGGLLAGLGGAVLSTAVLDRFEQHTPAGLGFMALAAMVFGRWTPVGAFLAALFFAFGNALRIGLASSAPHLMDLVPQGVLLALPYLMTLVLLGLQGQRSSAPAALGVPFEQESR
ncbi:ABC transporter permease [Corallococcus sp. H22C18031201]|uniref:ABC transporter permease n=1 Tax=Citreicoccus inhibens TaxID=2849499 RepID=UPI000E75A3A3|nr:ABC transporter permease [Citreicoccus inhibens]MBU8900682.1 ABC transporter permease [Citreicoccus inhibens]RJS25794.1 ABC transporter permease [Corallococcus sp. H22C18031201]